MVITDVNQVVYQGNGSNTAFPFTFRIIDATDVKLLLIDADGTETDITSDYFVDINTNTVHYPGYAPGSAPAEADQPAPIQTGQKLMIYRKLPITQEKDLGDKWPFSVIELGLDKLTMILQDIWDWCGRCLQVSRGQAADAGDDFDPTIPLEVDKVICGNANGTGFDAREAMMEVNGAWDGEGLPVSNVATPGKVDDAATKEYVDNLIDKLSVEADRYVVFNTVAAMVDADLPAGYNTRTLGYYDINDGGAGTYSIRGKVAGETEDGGSVIFLDNGNVAELIINDDTIYFKQFGAKEDGSTDDTTAVINAVAYATNKGISYVKSGGIVVTSETINVAFNFEFNNIDYTGNSYAVALTSQANRYIKGNKIYSSVGGGLLLTNSTGTCWHNIIEIIEIELPNGNANSCVDILPIGGIIENRYTFQRLLAPSGKGWNTYIPNNVSKYSYEGEDVIDIGVAKCNIGVNLEIEPDENDSSHTGTITGLNFLHLSVEGSVTGVRMKEGNRGDPNPPAGQAPGIKTIQIHNMRCRETGATTMFLDATGHLRDIMIYPTSGIFIHQWRLLTTTHWQTNICKIVGEIRNINSSVITIGYNLCSYNNRVFVEKPVDRLFGLGNGVTSVDFGNVLKKYKDEGTEGDTDSDFSDKKMYFGNYLYGGSNVDTTVTLKYWDACTLNNIILSVYKGHSITLTFLQNDGTMRSVTATNNTTDNRRAYRVIARYGDYKDDGGTSYLNRVYLDVVDLGAVTT